MTGRDNRLRQFLVTVMVHSACFLERQYCTFTGTARGPRNDSGKCRRRSRS